MSSTASTFLKNFNIVGSNSSNNIGCASSSFSFNDPAWRKWLYMLIIVFILFIILIPGNLISLPLNSNVTCENKIPLPGGAIGSCNGSTYIPGSEDPVTPLLANVICKQRSKCKQFFVSGYTSTWPNIFHSIVFLVIVNLISRYFVL